MAFLDIFVGVPQSKYAAFAIFAAIFVVSIGIMFGREEIPLGQKFALVLILFIMSLPGIIVTLFQLTCIVTGTSNGRTPWCGWYGWLASALTIVYCILLIVIAVIAMTTGTSVVKELQLEAMENIKDKVDTASTQAAAYFTNASAVSTPQTMGFEGFEGSPDGAVAPPHPKKDDSEKKNFTNAPIKGSVSVPAPVEQPAPPPPATPPPPPSIVEPFANEQVASKKLAGAPLF